MQCSTALCAGRHWKEFWQESGIGLHSRRKHRMYSSGASTTQSSTPGDPRVLIALENAGRIDPGSLQEYEQAGGFQALRRALDRTPEEIFQEVIDSGLQGRGGAGFPTGVKEKLTEESICGACGPKYVVCNADEGTRHLQRPGYYGARPPQSNRRNPYLRLCHRR